MVHALKFALRLPALEGFYQNEWLEFTIYKKIKRRISIYEEKNYYIDRHAKCKWIIAK